MNYKFNLSFFLGLLLFLCTANAVNAQTNACSGTITATYTSITDYPTTTQIGNGTAGSIKVCITTNNLSGTMCSGSVDEIVVSNNPVSTIYAQWTSATAAGTCYTFTTTTGYGYISFLNACSNAASSATITWSTVSGGSNVCPTCTDGIQNGTETGVDCGGTCTACTGNCFNGIQDGTETGVDCGGSCAVCPTCFDGVQNGTETGVDCGGTCALTCGTNSTVATTSCSCPTGVSATVYTTNCDQVGTTAFSVNSPTVSFANCASATTPSASSCTNTPSTDGTWVHLDLATGVTQLQLSLTGGSMGSGSSTCYANLYQGTSCAALTQVGSCSKVEDFISGSYGAYNVMWTGLDPTKDAWIYMWNDGGKSFTLNFQVIGTPSTPTNSTCATANAAAGEGCNLGATGASWTPPNGAGQSCSGGVWSSNENTTYYTFTPTASTATLSINSISCNTGSSGSAQFAVWTSCAAVGTYTSTSTYLGCAVGSTGTNLNLTGLTSGNTYYIAVDGSGGSDCVFTFTGTNVTLPIDILSFKALFDGEQVNINWSTAKEQNNDYFTVEKSTDGDHFEAIAIVKGARNSSTRLDYGTVDRTPALGTNYYRLTQTDYNGNTRHSGIDVVNIDENSTFSVIPNPTVGSAKVNYRCSDGETCVLTVYNTNGVPVSTQTVTCEKGLNSTFIDLTDKAKGIYIVVLTTETRTFKSKLAKSE